MAPDLRSNLRRQLASTIGRTDLVGLGAKYDGKVRDCYVTVDGKRIIVVTDRLSAFDRVITTIPSKGHVLNRIARHWFAETAHIAPNHMLEVPDPNVMIGVECVPLKVELVMRAFLTGVTSTSIWRAYERGDRTFCGHALPDGMVKNQALPEPLLTPTSKADKGDHDVSMSREELIASGAVTARDFDRAAEIAVALFAFGQARAGERGLILVDTKYEMGRAPSGEIVVIDEIHTPDSSRYWYADDHAQRVADRQEPRSLDKEYVRRWLAEQAGYRGEGDPPVVPDDVRVEAAARYVEICELITGAPFEPDMSVDPVGRIARNVGIEAGEVA